jgi:hypothetical protein
LTTSLPVVRVQQFLDVGAQLLVVAAGRDQKGVALTDRHFERGVKEIRQALPAVGVHGRRS